MKKHHIAHYLPLMGLFILGVVGLRYFQYDKSFQIAIVVALALSYISWGIVHHMLHKDLYFEVVVEYIVFAALGLALALSVLL